MSSWCCDACLKWFSKNYRRQKHESACRALVSRSERSNAIHPFQQPTSNPFSEAVNLREASLLNDLSSQRRYRDIMSKAVNLFNTQTFSEDGFVTVNHAQTSVKVHKSSIEDYIKNGVPPDLSQSYLASVFLPLHGHSPPDIDVFQSDNDVSSPNSSDNINIPVQSSSAPNFHFSAARNFYTWLCAWQLKNRVSAIALEDLLSNLQHFLAFHEKHVNAPEQSVAIADEEFLVNFPHSLPSTTHQARKKIGLDMGSAFNKFLHIQCHQCGHLYTDSKFSELKKLQLINKLIEREKDVYCEKCQSEFYHDHLDSERKIDISRKKRKREKSQSITGSQKKFPICRVYRQSLIDWIRRKCECDVWFSYINSWQEKAREESAPGGVKLYTDVYDGERWSKFKYDKEGRPLLHPDVPNSALAFSIFVDGFNPNNKSLKSICAIFISVLNLPREVRLLDHNVLLYALIPGKDQKHCSEQQLHGVLSMLKDELKELYHGIQVRDGVTLRGIFLNWVCDQPALRQSAGFIGHNAHRGCIHCKADLGVIKNNSESVSASVSTCSSACSSSQLSNESQETLNYFSGGQRYIEERLKSTKYYRTTTEQIENTPAIEEWTDIFDLKMPFDSTLKRSNSEVRRQMMEYIATTDEEERKKKREATGVKHTPFIDLEYYDPVDSCCIDVMHNIFLGLMKRYIGFLRNLVKVLKTSATNRNLELADLWMKLAHIPNDIGRMPTKWTGKLGYFKAIEWMNMISIFAVVVLTAVGANPLYIVPLIPLQQVAFIIRKQVISEEEIKKVDLNIRLFYSLSLYALGTGFNCPNLHFLLHLPYLLRLYGPPCNWWSYPYERFNNNVNQYSRNESNIEASMMRSWTMSSASIEKLEMLRNHALTIEQNTVEEELYKDHLPSSEFINQRIGQLVGSESIGAQSSSVIKHKINSQGRATGLIYQSSKKLYSQMVRWASDHEVRVKGTEPIPFFPKDNAARLPRQSFVLSQGWKATKTKGKAPLSPPPSICVLSKELLKQYYCSKYGETGWDVKDSDLIQTYKEIQVCGETYSSKWAGDSNGFICALFYDKKARTTYPWFAQVCFYFSHDLLVTQHSSDGSLLQNVPIRHHYAFVTWYDQPKDEDMKIESWISQSDLVKDLSQARRITTKKKKSKNTKDKQIKKSGNITLTHTDKKKKKAKKAVAEDTTNGEEDDFVFVQEDIDTDVKENDRLLLQKRTKELETKKVFDKQHEYQLQLSNILLDRLRQDFPLISSFPHPDSLDSTSPADCHRILPIARIWGRVCIGPAASSNLRVAMHIPSRRHG